MKTPLQNVCTKTTWISCLVGLTAGLIVMPMVVAQTQQPNGVRPGRATNQLGPGSPGRFGTNRFGTNFPRGIPGPTNVVPPQGTNRLAPPDTPPYDPGKVRPPVPGAPPYDPGKVPPVPPSRPPYDPGRAKPIIPVNPPPPPPTPKP